MGNLQGSEDELRKHFEANMLDGDAIQDGQMLSSQSVFDYMVETIRLREQSLTKSLLAEVEKRGPKDCSEPIADFEAGVNLTNAKWRQCVEAIRQERLGTKEGE